MPDSTEMIKFAHGGNEYSVTVPSGLSDAQAYDWAMKNKPKFAQLNLPRPKAKALPLSGTPGAKIGAAPGGVGGWLEQLESDIRYGGGVTVPGRLLKRMGAPGLEAGVSREVGEFMGSPMLGTVHAAQGLAMLPQHPWAGAKKTVSGALEAGTIPGLIAAGPTEEGATLLSKGEEVLKAFRAAKAGEKVTTALRRVNELLGVTARELRTGKAPGAIQEFVTNPARGVVESGLDAKSLAKMTPVERNQAVVAARDVAGQKLGAAFKEASDAGAVVNLKDTVDAIFKEIPDRRLMQQTRARLTQIVNRALGKPNVFEEIPYSQLLHELTGVSPSQAHAIRMGLDDFANFAPEGAVKTFSDVAASLRRGIAGKIRELLPDTKGLDRHYSDLAAAAQATGKQLKAFARKGPPPSMWRKTILPWLIRGAAGTAGGEAVYQLGKGVGLWGGAVPGGR